MSSSEETTMIEMIIAIIATLTYLIQRVDLPGVVGGIVGASGSLTVALVSVAEYFRSLQYGIDQ